MVTNRFVLYARVDEDTKLKFEYVCRQYGTTGSQALRDFAEYVCENSEFPIEVKKKLSPLGKMESLVNYFMAIRGKNCVLEEAEIYDFLRETYGEEEPLPRLADYLYNVCMTGFVNAPEQRLFEMVDRTSFKCLGHIANYTGPLYKLNHHGQWFLQIGEFQNGKLYLYNMKDFREHGEQFAPWIHTIKPGDIDAWEREPYNSLKASFKSYLMEGGRNSTDAAVLTSDAFFMYRVFDKIGLVNEFWDLVRSGDPERMFEAFKKYQVSRGHSENSPSFNSYRRAFRILYEFLFMK